MAIDPTGAFTNLSSSDLFHLNHATSEQQSPLSVCAVPLVKLGVSQKSDLFCCKLAGLRKVKAEQSCG